MNAEEAPPRRILLVHERYQQAGGEDGVFAMQAALLRERGHAVSTLEVDNDEIAAITGLNGRLRLAIDTVWSREGARRVRAAIRATRPEILHAHNTFPLLSPAIFAAAHDEGVATVLTLHNFRLVCPSAVLFRDGAPCHDCVGLALGLPGVIHACYRGSRAATATVAAMAAFHRARRTWARDVDRFVVLAPFMRDLLTRGGFPRARMTVAPNVVARPPAIAAPTVGPFLFVGRLAEEKGVRVLLDAWRRLDGRLPLEIAGSGPLEMDVRAAAASDASITYLGRLDRAGVDAALARSVALVVPSVWYEVCPLTIIEAFASGRPVIGSGHGGIADLIVDGESGWHVRPGDPADLAAVVSRVAADPAGRRAAGEAARRIFEERHSLDRGHGDLLQVYDAALQRRHRTSASGRR